MHLKVVTSSAPGMPTMIIVVQKIVPQTEGEGEGGGTAKKATAVGSLC